MNCFGGARLGWAVAHACALPVPHVERVLLSRFFSRSRCFEAISLKLYPHIYSPCLQASLGPPADCLSVIVSYLFTRTTLRRSRNVDGRRPRLFAKEAPEACLFSGTKMKIRAAPRQAAGGQRWR